jgi:hypothetical protein
MTSCHRAGTKIDHRHHRDAPAADLKLWVGSGVGAGRYQAARHKVGVLVSKDGSM